MKATAHVGLIVQDVGKGLGQRGVGADPAHLDLTLGVAPISRDLSMVVAGLVSVVNAIPTQGPGARRSQNAQHKGGQHTQGAGSQHTGVQAPRFAKVPRRLLTVKIGSIPIAPGPCLAIHSLFPGGLFTGSKEFDHDR